MKNEFGITLDQAGYAPSILQSRDGCYLCGRGRGAKLDRHEPFGGLQNRQKSKELGLWVNLCHLGCHEGPGSVHDEPARNRELRKDAQRAAMLRYGWSREEFISRFGKSELDEEECSKILTPAKTERLIEISRAPDDGGRVGALIRELFPTHNSQFRLVDGPELPF